MNHRSPLFARFASHAARWAGHPASFFLAVTTIVIWAALGRVFHFSDTWQLVINTSTTIVTFLMVFIIQNTQNRDTYAVHIKLDELIRVTQGAHNALLALEHLSDSEIAAVQKQYRELAERAREEMRQGGGDTGTPDVEQSGEALKGNPKP